MKLYFSPLACSLASRITLYEAGIDANFEAVDPRNKRLPDGSDYREIYPLGLVPALRTDDGELVTENVAVLEHLGARWQGASDARSQRLRLQWLSYISTELHKGVFHILFDPEASDAVKAYALEESKPRLAYLDRHLTGREFVLDELGVVDVYLYTVLNWTLAAPVELGAYPALKAFHARMSARPHVKRAFEEELPMYRAEQARAAS